MTLVQVALDFTSLEEALDVARSCVEAGIQVLEAGTPLIKAEGERAIRALSEEFPERLIVADTKTMDVGKLEARMVLKAGGDVGCVLGAAPEETISSFVGKMHRSAAGALVDTIGCDPEDVVEKLSRIEEPPDYLLLHAAIDEPIHGGELLEDADVDDVDVGLAVAGGLTPERIDEIDGVDLIIVGGYITGAEDPEGAARDVLEAAGSEPYRYRPNPSEIEFLRSLRRHDVVAAIEPGNEVLNAALNILKWRRPNLEVAEAGDLSEVPDGGDVLVVKGADGWSGGDLKKAVDGFRKVILVADDNVLKLHGIADAVVEF